MIIIVTKMQTFLESFGMAGVSSSSVVVATHFRST